MARQPARCRSLSNLCDGAAAMRVRGAGPARAAGSRPRMRAASTPSQQARACAATTRPRCRGMWRVRGRAGACTLPVRCSAGCLAPRFWACCAARCRFVWAPACSPRPCARCGAEALGGWRELLAGCGLIFVHAPSSNWQQLFGGEQPLLDKGDARVRWGVRAPGLAWRRTCRPPAPSRRSLRVGQAHRAAVSATCCCPARSCPALPLPWPAFHPAAAGECPSRRGGRHSAKRSGWLASW